jgi:hypothetical protein
LYSLALGYAIYIFVEWGQGNILPTITSQTQVLNYGVVDFEQSPITLQMFKNSPDSVEPFEATNNILTPLMYILVNDGIEGPYTLFTNPNDPIMPTETKAI